MKKYYNDIELLEQYNEGRLNQEEEHDVKSRLVNDEEFRALYDDMELMIEGILASGRESSLEEKIATIGGTLQSTARKDRTTWNESTQTFALSWYRRPVFAIAASLLLLAIAIALIFNPFGPLTNDELFDAHFVVAMNTYDVERGATDESLKLSALAAYDAGRYQESVGFFQKYIEGTDDDINERYLQANAYMALSDYDRAIEILVTVEEDGDGLKIPAKWYLGLCYLKTGENEKARMLMEAVSESGNENAGKAQEILNKMEPTLKL